MSENPPAAVQRRIRWWPLLLLVLGTAAVLAWLWWKPAPTRQYQVKRTLRVLRIAALLVPVWLLLLSGLRLRTRILGTALLVAVGAAATASLRVRGVTGDLVPILEWRWTEHPAEDADLTPEASRSERPLEEPGPEDFGQFLGPTRDARITGRGLQTDWQAHSPKLLWKQPVGEGWSSFAVAGRDAITQEQRGDQELVVCYERDTGKIRWSHADATRYDSDQAGVGPRATPTITATRVISVGATGRLNCLDRRDGTLAWSKDLLAEHGAEQPRWGMAGSPLVHGGQVIVSAGGPAGRSLAAYEVETGAEVWTAGNQPAGYSSPQVRTLLGSPQILIFQKGRLIAHDPQDGHVLWHVPWPAVGTEAIAQPLVLSGDRVLVASGYGVGARMFQVARKDEQGIEATLLWRSVALKPKFTNVVFHEEHVYGLDDGVLACVELKRGRRVWKDGRYGHGQLLLVEDLLLIQTESGDVVLVAASPEGHQELTRFAALDGKTWNSPALAGNQLFVRNDREAACYELAMSTAAVVER